MNAHRRRRPGFASRLCRALLALSVIGALLSAPIAATAHELGHLKNGASELFPQQGELAQACDVCAAYGGLGHALACQPAAVPAAPLVALDARRLGLRPDCGRFPLYLERAPPRSSASV